MKPIAQEDAIEGGGPEGRKIAVLLLQLGGPSTTKDIVPFLTELFADVLPLPSPIARSLGRLIAKRRIDEVQPLYEEIGGGSPLLGHTQAQADALQAALSAQHIDAEMLIAMRYAPPRLADALKSWRSLPEGTPLIVLPLYPQYSYATTRSSLLELNEQLKIQERVHLGIVSSYQAAPGYLKAMAQTIEPFLPKKGEDLSDSRLVFSAHGLPMSLVRGGDPYPNHIQETLDGVLAYFSKEHIDVPKSVLCFQSRVGPVKWLTPSTEDTLIELGKSGVKRVIVIPIAFVSEHIETLHELDIQLRETAEEHGIAHYARAPTVMTNANFIAALASEVQRVLDQVSRRLTSEAPIKIAV